LLGRDGRSQMLTGLRGVGKTVMLNEFEQLADGRGHFHEHVEVGEDGDLTPRLAAALRRLLLSMDAKRRIGDRIRRALGILKAFSVRIPGAPEFSIDVDAVYGPADSGDLATDFSGLFIEIGEVARDHDLGVLITIDELHYVGTSILEAVVMGLHRAAQLSLPITIAGAGLPSLATLTGEAKSYAERMFTFPVIGSLSGAQANEALSLPAGDEGVQWTDAALNRVIEVTRGYPYFLQEFGKQAWDVAAGPDEITADDVERSIPVATAELDDGFFRVRTGRTSDPERAYLRAMAEVGPGPVKSGEVAALLNRKTTALGPTRDGLLKKALCYSPRWGEIDFTVPMFDDFMKRWIPDIRSLSN
jgi:AAA ATPase domain